MAAAIEALILLLVLGIAYAIFAEGLWGATLMFFNVLFSSLLAFNCYEPLAGMIASSVPDVAGFADTFCLMLIFLISLIVFRVTTGSLAPKLIRVPPILKILGGLTFGLLTGVLTIGFILVAFDTAPVHRQVFSALGYERKPPFGLGFDRQFLGLFQVSSGVAFARHGYEPDPSGTYGDVRVFDPNGDWLIDHQNARPYGEPKVPGLKEGATTTPAKAP